MFQKLVSHNPDLQKLVVKGYAVAFDSGYLIIRDIPYLDNQLQLQIGAIVTKLVLVNEERVIQEDHQVFFAGSAPHGLDGAPIPNLGGGITQLALSDVHKDVVVQRSFSNKPRVAGKFEDFFEKIESYVGIISGPAIEIFDTTPFTFRTVEATPGSVFKYHDTLTSRAEITDLSSRFGNDVIALIGLGGTGAYILDHLVKTPVKEIRSFDPDNFYVHNAFRSPGKLDGSELGKSKVDVYQARYDGFRHGLHFEHRFIDATCGEVLSDVTFAFVCVDRGPARAGIIEILINNSIPFIDVGMGLNRRRGALNGMARVTYFSAEQGRAVRDKGIVPISDGPDDLYRVNIQIGELNALNASLAVIRYKQIKGFYVDDTQDYQILFGFGDLRTSGESVI